MSEVVNPTVQSTEPAGERDLLERGPMQLQLSHLLRTAGEGRGTLVFLGGEAGIGKTSVMHRFAARVAGNARVRIGACDPLTTPRPLGPLWDMRDEFGARLTDLLDRGAGRDALFRGFLAEIGDGPGQTLVVLEDVHWGDDATLDLLHFLARRVVALPALIIATYREDEVGDGHPLRVVLGDTATLPAVRRLALEPLSLAAERRPQLTTRQLEILHQLVEGRRNAEIARRLFLSPKTIGHHLSAVLAKLGATTRTEAVGAARRMGILDEQ
jgi:DNA-binding CsgD family transcriptional regulator